MSNTPWKAKTLVGLAPTYPAIGGLAPNTPCSWAPWIAAARAQDSVPATSRRIVAEFHISGAQDWKQPNGTSDPGATDEVPAQLYPTNAWRTLGNLPAHVTPGCELVAEVIYAPSGLVQKQVPPDAITGNTWASDGAWAEVRVGVTWTNGASSTGPHYRSTMLEGSPLGTYTGLELSQAGASWGATKTKLIEQIRPPNYATSPAIADAYSEWTDALITLQERGGARVFQVIVYEVPLAHVTDDAESGLVSVHAVPPGSSPLTLGPQTKAPDGTTYDENRFGTRRLAQVAERQSDRLGPRIMHWTSWDESDAWNASETEGNAATTTSSSFVDVLGGSATYDAGNPGWACAGGHARLHRLCDPGLIARGRFAVVPVRVRVDASRTAGTGTVRVQCGAYEWVDVSITGGRAVYQATGRLQSQRHADDASPPICIYMRTTAGTLSVWSVTVDFGDWVS